jgi:thiol-disulfide isomerase/thioredoxin
MRLSYYLSPVFLGFFLLFGCTTQINHRVNDSVGAPMRDLQNNPIRFANYQGKWVLVNYWASYCEACVAEIPELNKFYQAHRQDAMVIGVSYDDVSAAALRQTVQKLGITYPVVSQQFDPSAKFGISPPQGMPTTVVISPNGMVTEQVVGPQSLRSLERLIGK